MIKLEGSNYAIIITSLITILLKLFVYNSTGINETHFNIIFYVILTTALFVTYIKYVEFYNNIFYIFFLSLLLLVIFPICHEILYNNTQNNYTYNEDFLNYKKKETTLKLEKFKDVDKLIKISNLLPVEIQNKKIEDTLIGKKFNYKNGHLVIASGLIGRRPKSRDRNFMNYDIEFYNQNSIKIGSIIVDEESIIEGIHKKYNDRKLLNGILKNPESDVHYVDIWLDSITVFIFSNIKPIGRFAQIIQLFQVITSFIFVYILTSLLDNFKQLKITKKKSVNE